MPEFTRIGIDPGDSLVYIGHHDYSTPPLVHLPFGAGR